jgi:hypothetical protein
VTQTITQVTKTITDDREHGEHRPRPHCDLAMPTSAFMVLMARQKHRFILHSRPTPLQETAFRRLELDPGPLGALETGFAALQAAP